MTENVTTDPDTADGHTRSWAFVVVGLVVSLVLAFALSRFASTEPDGLERVAADNGLDTARTDHALAQGPFAGYETKAIGDTDLATGVAGLVGVVATFSVAGGVVWLVGRHRTPSGPDHHEGP